MEKIIKIYQAIKIKSIVYETGDTEARINCDLKYSSQTISTKLLVSQTDLNRLIAKMATTGTDWLENNMETLYLEDGTQLIEYNFDKSNNQIIHDFHFNNTYAQIGA
ncbi:MAG: hypothetical protein AB8B74_14825 [Crocinitomicaceae bacterium]